MRRQLVSMCVIVGVVAGMPALGSKIGVRVSKNWGQQQKLGSEYIFVGLRVFPFAPSPCFTDETSSDFRLNLHEHFSLAWRRHSK